MQLPGLIFYCKNRWLPASSAAKQTSRAIAELSVLAREIGSTISLIHDIVGQITPLVLNTTIEANSTTGFGAFTWNACSLAPDRETSIIQHP